MRQDPEPLDAPAHVPDVRRHAVLRLVAEPSRQYTRARQHASGDCVGGAGRAMAVLLSGRCVRGVLRAVLLHCLATVFCANRVAYGARPPHWPVVADARRRRDESLTRSSRSRTSCAALRVSSADVGRPVAGGRRVRCPDRAPCGVLRSTDRVPPDTGVRTLTADRLARRSRGGTICSRREPGRRRRSPPSRPRRDSRGGSRDKRPGRRCAGRHATCARARHAPPAGQAMSRGRA